MLKKALLKFIKNNDGFTLVEVIVSLAILSIVLVVAGRALFFGINLFTQTEVKNTEKSIGDASFKYMKQKLIYASTLEVLPNIAENTNKKPMYSNEIKIGTDETKIGHLVFGVYDEESKDYKEEDVLGKSYYGNYSLSYTVKVLDEERLKLTVNVKNNDDTVAYTTESIIRNLNLKNNSKKILVTNGKYDVAYNDPVISYGEEISVSTTYDPLSMYNQMKLLVNNAKKGIYPSDYKEITGAVYYINNDRFRSYIAQKYYKGTPYYGNSDAEQTVSAMPNFPGFSEDIVQSVDAKIQETTDSGRFKGNRLLSDYLKTPGLKMQVFLSEKDNSIFVYASEKKGWYVSLVYNHEEGAWYYYFRNSSTNVNLPWTELKANIENQDMDKNPNLTGDMVDRWIKIAK